MDFGRILNLVENSLLRQTGGSDGAPRFRMLETLHTHAVVHLEASGEAIAVRQQHAAYYLQLAETVAPHLITAERDPWLERLEAEHDNLRSALAWCEAQAEQGETMLRLTTALVDFWWKHLGEGVDWAHRALRCSVPPLATADGGRSELMRLRARALLTAGGLARMWGDYALASSDAEESIALYEALDDQAGLADALGLAGNSALDVAPVLPQSFTLCALTHPRGKPVV